MKKILFCSIVLLLALLLLQPAALADFHPQPELPESLRNFVDEDTERVNIRGTDIDMEKVFFLDDCAVGDELELCVAEVPEDATVFPVDELPPDTHTELRRESVREHEEALAQRNAEREEPEETRHIGVPEDPTLDREASYLYLVGETRQTGSYLFFVLADDDFYLFSLDVLSALPGEPVIWPEPPIVTEPPIFTQPPVVTQPPVFTQPPVTPLSVFVTGPTECRTGDSAVLSANVAGSTGRISYQWYYSMGPYSAQVDGANRDSLTLDTSRAGTWNYFCLVTDSAGRQAISEPLTVTVAERQADAIMIEAMPSKTKYYDGQSIDTAGLRLLVRYDDGSVDHVSEGFTVSPETAVYTGGGTQRVWVSYRGASASYTVSVGSAWDAVSGIAVVKLPYKSSYYVGDTLDTAGLILRIYNVDGGYIDMDHNFACSPTRLYDAGRQVITVRFGDRACTFTVDVRLPAPPTPTPTPTPTPRPVVTQAPAKERKTYRSGDYEYSLMSNGTAEITAYSGSAESLVIPERLDGYAVSAIGGGAFASNGALSSVTIPDGVTSVGANPFRDCKSLKSILVSPEHSALATIRGALFSKADKRLVCCPCALSASTYAIPQGIKLIGDAAFSGCTGLTSVTIPDSVTFIGDGVFYRCAGLRSVTIPDGVSSIGDYTFYRCTGLKSVVIPDGAASIGDYAFYRCTGLILVSIPKSVASIGDYAFYRCTSLPSVTIPEGVTTIGDRAFSGCGSLTAVTIPDGVTMIEDWAFAGCGDLASVTIPDSVASIGRDAFSDCGPQLVITVGRNSRAKDYCRQNGLSYIYPDSYDWLNN